MATMIRPHPAHPLRALSCRRRRRRHRRPVTADARTDAGRREPPRFRRWQRGLARNAMQPPRPPMPTGCASRSATRRLLPPLRAAAATTEERSYPPVMSLHDDEQSSTSDADLYDSTLMPRPDVPAHLAAMNPALVRSAAGPRASIRPIDPALVDGDTQRDPCQAKGMIEERSTRWPSWTGPTTARAMPSSPPGCSMPVSLPA